MLNSKYILLIKKNTIRFYDRTFVTGNMKVLGKVCEKELKYLSILTVQKHEIHR